MAVDPRKFVLNTRYPTDKIIYLNKGSITASYSMEIPHDLGFAPLLDGVWSNDEQTWYSFGSGPVLTSAATGDQYQGVVSLSADSSSLYFIWGALGAPSDLGTIYYRIYGFTPDENDMSLDVEPTAGAGKTFILNTRNNYTKLALSGTVSLSSGNATVPHGLGFVPQVAIWQETSELGGENRISKWVPNSNGGIDDGIYVDADNLYLTKGSNPSINALRYYYRIYADVG
jgi:hypothetical protein